MSVLSAGLGRGPSCSELAAYLGVDGEAVVEALENAGSSSCLFTPVFESAEAETKRPPAPVINARDRWLLDLRFRRGLSQSQIASLVGLSPVVVGPALRNALNRLPAPLAPRPSTPH